MFGYEVLKFVHYQTILSTVICTHLNYRYPLQRVLCLFVMFVLGYDTEADWTCYNSQVAFGMDLEIISGKDNKFSEAVSLSFHGVEEASFDIFHRVCSLSYHYLALCQAQGLRFNFQLPHCAKTSTGKKKVL